MVRYACLFCKREIKPEEIKKRVRCPYCGGRIIYKKRPPILKHVKAR